MKKQCKRKPRDISAMLRRRTGLDTSQKVDLGLAYHGALTAMERGHGDEQTHATLCCVINLGYMLCEHNVMPEHSPDMKSAQDALIACKWRSEEYFTWAFTAQEMKALRIALSLHDQQNAIAPVGLIEKCLQEMHAILKS